MKSVSEFLIKNGFKQESKRVFKTGKCKLTFNKDCYCIEAPGRLCYSVDFNLYWLIGYLTFNNFIDKNYMI